MLYVALLSGYIAFFGSVGSSDCSSEWPGGGDCRRLCPLVVAWSKFRCCLNKFEGFVGRHAELNVADCLNVKDDRGFDRFGKDVGNGGSSRSKHIEHIDKPATAKRDGFALKSPEGKKGVVKSMVDVVERSSDSTAASELGSGGKGALEQIKTGGKGRMIDAVMSGGRDGLIGGVKGCLGYPGHGHGQGHVQARERAHLSSVAAPLGTSPEACHDYAGLKTTPTTTTNNNVLDSMSHIDNTLNTILFLFPIH